MKTRIIAIIVLTILGLSLFSATYFLKLDKTNFIPRKERVNEKQTLNTWRERINSIKENGMLPIIDTEATYETDIDIDFMIKSMDDLGVALIAFAPKFLDPEKGSIESMRLSTLYPQYFIPTITDATTEYWTKQEGKFMEKIEKEAKSGNYYFIGEFELRHYMSVQDFFLNNTSRDISIHPESIWVQKIFNISSEEQLTFQIHNDLEDDLAQPLENMFSRYPNAQVIWTHLGQVRYPDKQTTYSPSYIDTLLKKYNNLYFDLGVSLPERVYPGTGFTQNTLQNLSGKISIEWKKIIEKYPNRFTIGSDIAGNRYESFPQKIKNARIMLAQLSKSTAEKIAYKNAWRLITRTEWDEN